MQKEIPARCQDSSIDAGKRGRLSASQRRYVRWLAIYRGIDTGDNFPRPARQVAPCLGRRPATDCSREHLLAGGGAPRRQRRPARSRWFARRVLWISGQQKREAVGQKRRRRQNLVKSAHRNPPIGAPRKIIHFAHRWFQPAASILYTRENRIRLPGRSRHSITHVVAFASWPTSYRLYRTRLAIPPQPPAARRQSVVGFVVSPIRHALAVLGVSPVLVTLVYHAAPRRFPRWGQHSGGLSIQGVTEFTKAESRLSVPRSCSAAAPH